LNLFTKLLAGAVAVGALAIAGFYAMSPIKQLPPDAQPTTVIHHSDIPQYSEIKKLVSSSDAVFIGTVEGISGTRNLARDPKDPSKEDPEILVEGVDYKVTIKEFLKGHDQDPQVLVTENRSVQYRKNDPVAVDEHFIDLIPGETYVFFTDKSQTTGRYFATGDPFFFQINHSSVQVKSNSKELEKYFPTEDVSTFSKKVKDAQ
jgi:hypothetical protein